MFVLPRGITGIRHHSDPPLPVTDLRSFRGHCHAAARLLGGEVLAVETPVAGSANFARITLALPAGRVAVLLNLVHPVVAFAEPAVENDLTLKFVDNAALADVFQKFGSYRVLSASEARSPIRPDACESLTEDEHNQLRYWNPQWIGDVVFNYWD